MRMASLGIREGWELKGKWQRKKAEAGEGKGEEGGRWEHCGPCEPVEACVRFWATLCT